MFKKLASSARSTVTQIIAAISRTKLSRATIAAIRRLAQRHVELMNETPSYRAQIAAAAAAIIALLDLPTGWATLILAAIALYVAAHTQRGDGGWHHRPLGGPDDYDTPW